MAKFWAHGSSITIGGTAVGGVVSIDLPSQSRGEVDISDGDSGGDAEFVQGIRDNGSVGLELRLDLEDAGQTALVTNFNAASGTTATFIITLPAAAGATSPMTVTFDGYVSDLGGSLPQTGNEAGSRTVTIRVSGAVTEDVGT